MTNPRTVTPAVDPRVHRSTAPARSLVENLGGVIDNARQLVVDIGFRPYEVFSVVVRWTGGERGRGKPVVISEQALLPVPKVEQLSSIRREALAGGVVKRGDVRLSQLSARYTEDDIHSLFPRELTSGEEHFIEVRHDSRDGETERQRYVVSGQPERRAARFDWTANLTKQDQDRARDGSAR